jgi:hypothetical protein
MQDFAGPSTVGLLVGLRMEVLRGFNDVFTQLLMVVYNKPFYGDTLGYYGDILGCIHESYIYIYIYVYIHMKPPLMEGSLPTKMGG